MAVCALRAGLWEVIGSFRIRGVALEAVVAGGTGDRMNSGGQAVFASWACVALISDTGSALILTP